MLTPRDEFNGSGVFITSEQERFGEPLQIKTE
jgi:hypothetical protein